MKVGQLELNFHLTCKPCGAVVTGSTEKRAWLWLTLHLKFFCKKGSEARASIPLLKTLWQLWRWPSPKF